MVHTISMCRRCVVGALALLALSMYPSGASAYPNPGTVQGDTGIHDPSMLLRSSAPRYVVYGTHNESLVSPGRVTFATGGPYLAPSTWWAPFIQPVNTTNPSVDVPPWAPDVSEHNGVYWMYYSVSSFGKQNSAIGLATSSTGLPGTWIDQGVVLTSNSTSQFNAIDPSLFVDDNGDWWLTFGSFWHGIYMVALDPQTGKLSAGTPTFHHLAERPPAPPDTYDPYKDAIEAPFVYKRNGYYYLFVSFGYCCRGTSSTSYSIRVGRSDAPTGPYFDGSPTPVNMLDGGGTPVLETHGSVIGPGGQSVYHDDADNHDLLVYHYYDANAGGEPTLGINWLGWDAAGFPFAY